MTVEERNVRKTRSGWWVLAGWLGCAALAAGCGAGKGEVRSDARPGEGGDKGSGGSIHIEKRGEEKVTTFDLNHDGKPDVWAYTVQGKGADGKDIDKLVRKELDINFDGKVDITRYYDDKEQLAREVFDLDYDGRIDQINYYEKGLIVRKERFLDNGDKPRIWVFYEKGKIVRKEKDTKGTGRVDYWEYWENDQVDRIGEDLDGDGNVDRWTKNPETASGG